MDKQRNRKAHRNPRSRRSTITEPHDVILYPLMTESASLMVEKENKLVFIVNLKASKAEVQKAVEQLYEAKVQTVNILITSTGEKKAFVKLHPEYKASDIAIKLGIL